MSGGIALLVKNDLCPFITVLDTNSKVALWFKISSRIAQTEEDLTCAAIYIPHINQNTRFLTHISSYKLSYRDTVVHQSMY